jgi:hypothetical protein
MACGNAIAQSRYSSVFNRDPLARKLTTSDLYVNRTYWPKIDPARLQLLLSLNRTGLPVKVALIQKFPTYGGVFKSEGSYTNALHSWLKLGPGILIVLAPHRVSAATNAIKASQLDNILRIVPSPSKPDPFQVIPNIVADTHWFQGRNTFTDAIAHGKFNRYSVNETSPVNSISFPSNPLVTIVLELLVCIFGTVLMITILKFIMDLVSEPKTADVIPNPFVGSSVPQPVEDSGFQERVEDRDSGRPVTSSSNIVTQVQDLHEFVIENISLIDKYLEVLPSSEHQARARLARDRAAALDRQVQLLAQRLTPDNGACDYLSCSKAAINLATNPTGQTSSAANGIMLNEPTLVFDTATLMLEEIPLEERGACFFCSKPSRIPQLTVVNVTVNGQRRKVLVCAEDMQIIRRGAVPKIRMESISGGFVPWYLAPDYDPYRDYFNGSAYYSPNSGMRDGLAFGTSGSTANGNNDVESTYATNVTAYPVCAHNAENERGDHQRMSLPVPIDPPSVVVDVKPG